MSTDRDVEEFLRGHPFAAEVFDRVRSIMRGSCVVRVSKSQIAFRRDRGFAYLWLPGRYLRSPAAEVVLSIVLGRHDPSPRFKQVAHPSPAHWIHHLEVRDLGEVDTEVANWLLEAADHARR
ncbi:DUF5655 domain-containing protein [Actinokineospora sp. HUAS TT18]|uniref:DUF5655 domain-containing protein n=1 Tax=Actinokineospora sp. HUAS TT18 TaxID=3447451 RepID=UPI003F51C11F